MRTSRSPTRARGPGSLFDEGFADLWKGGTDMDIRDERYLDFIAMLLISILLLGLSLFEVAMVVLSRSSQG